MRYNIYLIDQKKLSSSRLGWHKYLTFWANKMFYKLFDDDWLWTADPEATAVTNEPKPFSAHFLGDKILLPFWPK